MMVNRILRSGALAALLWSGSAIAQTAAETPAQAPAQAAAAPSAAPVTRDADPALWVVKDADTTIYLFGTVHVLKPGLSWLDEAVKTAFDGSNELVLELVLPEPATAQAAVMKYAVNPAGPTLTEKLPADQRAAYAKALGDMGLPATAFDRFDPWFAATTLTQVSLAKSGYDPASGAEMVLTQAAKSGNKPVSGLETLDEQLGFFDNLSERSQIAFMSETLKELPEAGATIDKMVDQWAAGQTDALAATINEGMKATPEIAKLLLSDRNERWAAWIKQRLNKPGTVFVAVGAGHLAGPNSVQAKLAPLKIRATRISY